MSPRANFPQSRFEEQFDALPSTWIAQAGTGTETIQAFSDPQSGVPGNAYQAAGYRWREYPINILFDPNKLYRMRIRARRTATSDAATQFLWCGVAGISADGVTYVNINGQNQFGSQHYYVATSFDMTGVPLNEWRVLEGYMQGRNANKGVGTLANPCGLHKDAKYFRPLFIVNYNAGPAGNVTQIDYITIEVMSDTGEFVHLIEVGFSGGFVRVNTGATDLNIDLPDQLLGSDAAALHSGQYEYVGFTESSPKLLTSLGLIVGDMLNFSALVWNTTAGSNERIRLRFWSAGPTLISTFDSSPLQNTLIPRPVRLSAIVIPANATMVSARCITGGAGTTQIKSAKLSKQATFEAIGGNLQIGSTEESADSGNQGVEVQLSGVDQTIIGALLNNSFRGRTVKIWRAILDPITGMAVPELTLQLIEGLQLDPYEVSEDRARGGGTVVVKTRVRGRMGVDRLRGIWANVTSHQHIFPGDTFFQNAAALSNTPIYWGVAKPINIGPGGSHYDSPNNGGGDQFLPG